MNAPQVSWTLLLSLLTVLTPLISAAEGVPAPTNTSALPLDAMGRPIPLNYLLQYTVQQNLTALSNNQGKYDTVNGSLVKLPLFGELYFAPAEIPDDSQKAGRVARVAEQKQKTYTVGVVTLTDLNATVTEDGNLGLTATARFLSHTAQVTLNEITPDAVTFKVIPDTPLSFPLGKKTLTFPELILTISATTSSLSADQYVFIPQSDTADPDTHLQIGLSQMDSQATISFTALPLKEVIDLSSSSQAIQEVVITEAEATVPNPLFPEQVAYGVTISGIADLQRVIITEAVHLGKTRCVVTLNAMEASFEGQGTEPIMISNFPLYEPIVTLSFMPGQPPSMLLGGRMDLTLPGVGRVNQQFTGRQEFGMISLQTQGTGTITYNDFTLKNNQVNFTTQGAGQLRETMISVIGDSVIIGENVRLSLTFIQSLQAAGGFQVEVKGQLLKKNYRPFADTPAAETMPLLKEFTIDNPWVGLSSDGSLFIGGSHQFNNTVVEVEARTNPRGVSVKGNFKLPTDPQGRPIKPSWKLSDLIPGSPSIFDGIEFYNVSLIASSYSYYDSSLNMLMTPGVGLMASINSNAGIFEKAKAIFGRGVPPMINIMVILNPDPRLCMARAIIPLYVPLSPVVALNNIMIEISGQTGVSLLTGLLITPESQRPPMLFSSRIGFGPLGATLAGTLQGYWYDPFGFKGFSIGDLALEVVLPYVIPPIPTSVGLAGTMQLGPSKAQVAAKFGAQGFLLLGSLNRLSLNDLIGIARQIGVAIPDIPDLAIDFEDMQFKFAPTAMQIGELFYEPGYRLAGKLNLSIPGVIKNKAGVDIQIDPFMGIKAAGYLQNIKLGPLTITGNGLDGKPGTPDDGPAFKIALTPLEQKIYANGRVNLFGANDLLVDVLIQPTRLSFQTSLKLLGVFATELVVESFNNGGETGTGVRLYGTTDIGSSRAHVIGGITSKGAYVAGQLKEFSLKNICEVANTLGAHIPPEIAPPLGLKDVEFYVKAG